MQATSGTDHAARFAQDVEPLIDILSRGARRLTRSEADAEDLLQDALMHAYADAFLELVAPRRILRRFLGGIHRFDLHLLLT